ncbi:MAG: DUF459 domain-containing protein [Pseudolabrys sp.]
MFSKIRLPHWFLAVALLALGEGMGAALFEAAFVAPAEAQFFGNDRYQAPRRRSGGFFQDLFAPFGAPRYERDYEPSQQPSAPAESSRAPAARKVDKDQPPPTTSIVVMGDGMADWLAYGLEEAFADAPEIGIVRKNKINSGLLHYEARSDLDWWHVARDLLTPEKPSYVIMMLGVSDRQNISQRDLAKEAEKKAKDEKAKDDAAKTDKPAAAPEAQKKDTGDEGEAPAADRGKKPTGVVEFRSEQWEQIYSRRIDDTIAALKSKGVPVFWVGLPSIRGAKSTSDAVYLNDLYRARAERAGIVYIDVWDGFVDEAGKFSSFGPDFEGQNRRLRSGDGVYFTKYGARKLAHYVEREVRRYMSNRGPIALPAGPMGPVPSDGKPAVRPLAGPVVPLTVTPGNSDVLLGGPVAGPAHGDAIASQVLMKGEPIPAPRGRADDFVWPGAEQPPQPAPIATPPQAAPPAANRPAPQVNAAPQASVPPAAASSSASAPAIMQPEPAPAEPKPAEPKSTAAPKTQTPAQSTAQQRPRREETRPRPPQPVQQQPQPRRQTSPFGDGPFGLFR